MQIDDGIFVPPFPDDEENQGCRGDQGKSQDEMRLEPIVALALVEDDLKRTEAQRNEAQADVIDPCFVKLAALEIWWILNEPGGKQDRKNADGNVDEENPAPAEIVGYPSAQGVTDGGRSDDGDTVDGER